MGSKRPATTTQIFFGSDDFTTWHCLAVTLARCPYKNISEPQLTAQFCFDKNRYDLRKLLREAASGDHMICGSCFLKQLPESTSVSIWFFHPLTISLGVITKTEVATTISCIIYAKKSGCNFGPADQIPLTIDQTFLYDLRSVQKKCGCNFGPPNQRLQNHHDPESWILAAVGPAHLAIRRGRLWLAAAQTENRCHHCRACQPIWYAGSAMMVAIFSQRFQHCNVGEDLLKGLICIPRHLVYLEHDKHQSANQHDAEENSWPRECAHSSWALKHWLWLPLIPSSSLSRTDTARAPTEPDSRPIITSTIAKFFANMLSCLQVACMYVCLWVINW